jgi:hypothetical protein
MLTLTTPVLANASAFRTVAPEPFSASEEVRYGLSADQAALVAQYKSEGRLVDVLTAEEAASYRAGQFNDSDTMWVVVGAIVLIVLVAAAVD